MDWTIMAQEFGVYAQALVEKQVEVAMYQYQMQYTVSWICLVVGLLIIIGGLIAGFGDFTYDWTGPGLVIGLGVLLLLIGAGLLQDALVAIKQWTVNPEMMLFGKLTSVEAW